MPSVQAGAQVGTVCFPAALLGYTGSARCIPPKSKREKRCTRIGNITKKNSNLPVTKRKNVKVALILLSQEKTAKNWALLLFRGLFIHGVHSKFQGSAGRAMLSTLYWASATSCSSSEAGLAEGVTG